MAFIFCRASQPGLIGPFKTSNKMSTDMIGQAPKMHETAATITNGIFTCPGRFRTMAKNKPAMKNGSTSNENPV
jgi:hypothetical protein